MLARGVQEERGIIRQQQQNVSFLFSAIATRISVLIGLFVAQVLATLPVHTALAEPPILDTTGPSLAITTPGTDGPLRAPGAYTIRGTVSDSESGVRTMTIRIKDTSTSSMAVIDFITNINEEAWSYELPAETLLDGHGYEIEIKASDTLNNSTTAQRLITVDNTAPTGILSQTGNSSAVTVTLGSLSEPIQTPTGWSANGTDFTMMHTTNGNYSVQLLDAAGNATTLDYTITTIDEQPPVIRISKVVRNNDGSYTMTGSSDESLSEVQIAINGEPSLAGEVTGKMWSFTTAVLADGTYTADVVATDMNSNQGLITGYEFTALEPFTPVSQLNIAPVAPSEFITNMITASIPTNSTTRTVYVPEVTTDTAAATDDDDGLILGSETTKKVAKASVAAIEPSDQGWKLLGLAWYWWVGIIAAIGSAGWMGLGWFRGRGQV